MVTLIKNQIFKHLSRYTKNLSPDRINLSTLKGEGELSNLELDEVVLTDLLELPSWLKLTSAWCNRVCFRIQWTNIKTMPIVLRLDEVQVVIETCPDLRSMSTNQDLSSLSSGRYSFIHKVIDGMTITVNAVLVTFKSPVFVASVQVSRIVAESKTPTWKRNDLRMTRVKDTARGEILLFKEIEWQTVRIEAKSTENANLTPLRLLTNQARCRITIKKRLSDCFILGSRLVLILEDLLWVLTDSQLRAALYFVESLAGMVQKATEVSRKRKAARKIEMLPEYQAWVSQQARQQTAKKSAISKVFSQCDVIETSFHFLSEQIDLHLCDDDGDGRSSHPHLKDGGAFQIRLNHFKIDFYPYHLAVSDRKHWPSYEEDTHAEWLEQTLNNFRATFMDSIDAGAKAHTPLTRAEPHLDRSRTVSRESIDLRSHSAVKDYVTSRMAKLMSSCVILRLEDFTLFRVSTSSRKQAPKDFISSDKELYKLPVEMPLIHAEFTYFYYPDDVPFPLPPPQFNVFCNPIQIHFDLLTALWLQSFGLYLLRTLNALTENTTAAPSNDIFQIDVRIEAIMTRIILAENSSQDSLTLNRMQKDRPQHLQIQTSKAVITNIRSRTTGSRADLATCLNEMQQGELFFNSGFPTKDGDRPAVVDKLLQHVNAADSLRPHPDLSSITVAELSQGLDHKLFWTDAKDVWYMQVDPVWAEFTGMKSNPNKPVALVDAFPLNVWLCLLNQTDIYAVAHLPSLVSLQLNHYQFLFLSRLAEELSELATFLQMDSNNITGKESGCVCASVALPQLEITLVMPAHCHAKESFDVDSVIPESSSLADIPNIPFSAPKSAGFVQEEDVTTIQGEFFAEEVASVNDSSSIVLESSEPQSFKMSNFSTFSKGLASGFNNLMTSFDAKTGTDDNLDNMSVRSDGSSDSERYIVVNLEQQNRADILNAMFVVPAARKPQQVAIDEASDVLEEHEKASQHSEYSLLKRSDPVSIATFKLSRVEAIYQALGFNSCLRAQCSGVSAEECGSIPWDEFQSKFSSRTHGWSEEKNLTRSCSIKARLERQPEVPPTAELFSKTDIIGVIQQIFAEHLDAEVKNVNLTLSMNASTGLADLLKDEILPKPMPMNLVVENVQLHMSEDRSAVSQLASANSPVNMCISRLRVARTASGTIFVEPAEVSSGGDWKAVSGIDLEVESARRQVTELSRENEELRRRLLATERLHSEEKGKLNAKIDELHGERMALEVSIRKMQLTQAAMQADALNSKANQPTTSVKR